MSDNEPEPIEREEKLYGRLNLLPKNLAFSEDGQHMWFLDVSRKAFVGLHNDNNGSWIDLRSAAALNYPEFAVCVPKDGGAARLQVSNGKDAPVTVDLLAAVKLLNKLLGADENVTT